MCVCVCVSARYNCCCPFQEWNCGQSTGPQLTWIGYRYRWLKSSVQLVVLLRQLTLPLPRAGHEKLLEDQFLDNRLCRFALAREVEAVDPWVVSASDPVDAEQAHIFRSLCICVSVICVFAFVWCSSRPTLFENPLLVSARLFGTLSERLASPR